MNQTLSLPSAAHSAAAPVKAAKPAAPLNSQTLLGNATAVAIDHNGALYRLSTTKLGKLILTK